MPTLAQLSRQSAGPNATQFGSQLTIALAQLIKMISDFADESGDKQLKREILELEKQRLQGEISEDRVREKLRGEIAKNDALEQSIRQQAAEFEAKFETQVETGKQQLKALRQEADLKEIAGERSEVALDVEKKTAGARVKGAELGVEATEQQIGQREELFPGQLTQQGVNIAGTEAQTALQRQALTLQQQQAEQQQQTFLREQAKEDAEDPRSTASTAFIRLGALKDDLQKSQQFMGPENRDAWKQHTDGLRFLNQPIDISPRMQRVIKASQIEDTALRSDAMIQATIPVVSMWDETVSRYRESLKERNRILNDAGVPTPTPEQFERSFKNTVASHDLRRGVTPEFMEAVAIVAISNLRAEGVDLKGSFNPDEDGAQGYLIDDPDEGPGFDKGLVSSLGGEISKRVAARPKATSIQRARLVEDTFNRLGLSPDEAERMASLVDVRKPTVYNQDRIRDLVDDLVNELEEAGADELEVSELDAIPAATQLLQEARFQEVVRTEVASAQNMIVTKTVIDPVSKAPLQVRVLDEEQIQAMIEEPDRNPIPSPVGLINVREAFERERPVAKFLAEQRGFPESGPIPDIQTPPTKPQPQGPPIFAPLGDGLATPSASGARLPPRPSADPLDQLIPSTSAPPQGGLEQLGAQPTGEEVGRRIADEEAASRGQPQEGGAQGGAGDMEQLEQLLIEIGLETILSPAPPGGAGGGPQSPEEFLRRLQGPQQLVQPPSPFTGSF